MLIKFLPHGQGGGKGPTEYLTASEGREIAPEVLSGDPKITCDIIDSLDFKHKYTSGVIAFHQGDNPSREQIEEVIQEFEKTAFAGLEEDQYDVLWVKHEDKEKTELHFIVPRAELASGKSMNIRPPGDIKRYDDLRSYFNAKYSWANPDDPSRRQAISLPDHLHKNNAELKREWGLVPAKDAREVLHEFVEAEAAAGRIKGREDIPKFLESLGLKVTRKGKNYVSVADNEGKRYRLKGEIYSEYCHRAIERIKERANEHHQGITERNPGELQDLYRRIEAARGKRAELNKKKYGRAPSFEVVPPSRSYRNDCLYLRELVSGDGRDRVVAEYRKGTSRIRPDVEMRKIKRWFRKNPSSGITGIYRQLTGFIDAIAEGARPLLDLIKRPKRQVSQAQGIKL